MTHFWEVFKSEHDWVNWDKHIEFASIDSDIEESYRGRLVDAFNFLKKELEKGFLKNHSYTEHPFCKHMEFIKDPYSVAWLIWFGNTLKDLKNCAVNYRRLKKIVLGVKSCIEEGIPFLEIGSAALSCGLIVNFLEEDGKNKTPDIELINPVTNEKVVMEVSIVYELDTQKEDQIVYRKLTDLFMSGLPRVGFSGRIFQRPEKEELDKILKELDELKQRVFEEKTFCVYANDFLEIGLTHPSDTTEWLKWQESKGYLFEQIKSLPIKYDITRKIREQKITDKKKQIAENETGIIYLHVPWLFMFANDPYSTIEGVKSEINKYPNLFGVMITGTQKLSMEGGNGRREFGSSFYQGINFKGVLDQRIFVGNDQCKSLSADTVVKLTDLVNYFPFL